MNKNILVISDSLFSFSGVANSIKHVCKKLVQEGYNVVNISANNAAPNTISEFKFDTGEVVKCYANLMGKDAVGNLIPIYDNMQQIKFIVDKENIGSVLLQTDPHKFANIWNNANYFHSKHIPIIFISVWDTYMVPDERGIKHYNCNIYESCDAIACISRQTFWFTNHIMAKIPIKPHITYSGFGADPAIFKASSEDKCAEFKKNIFGGNDYEFIAFMSNKNQPRKKIPDLIEGWKIFFRQLSLEQRKKAALLLHTDQVSPLGFNMHAVINSLAPDCNIYLASGPMNELDIVKMNNISDVIINVSNAAGFELNVNEGMLCEKVVIANSTGGLNDQIGWKDQDGTCIEWTSSFKDKISRYKSGDWCYALPNQRTIIGSTVTWYLYDENCSIDKIADGLNYWYQIPAEKRKEYGRKAREFCLSNQLNSNDFAKNIANVVNHTIKNYKEKSLFNIYAI